MLFRFKHVSVLNNRVKYDFLNRSFSFLNGKLQFENLMHWSIEKNVIKWIFKGIFAYITAHLVVSEFILINIAQIERDECRRFLSIWFLFIFPTEWFFNWFLLKHKLVQIWLIPMSICWGKTGQLNFLCKFFMNLNYFQ